MENIPTAEIKRTAIQELANEILELEIPFQIKTLLIPIMSKKLKVEKQQKIEYANLQLQSLTDEIKEKAEVKINGFKVKVDKQSIQTITDNFIKQLK